MTRSYRVVWIDDECDHSDLMFGVVMPAAENGITLHGFRSFEEGFAYLEPNLQQVDAVLLDARFFEKREQVAGTEDLKGLSQAWARLNQLDGQRKLPRFILSGQPDIETDRFFSEIFGRHYRKSLPSDVAQLWHDIKAAADQQPLTQLRHRYADAFAACAPEYVGEEAGRYLLEILAFLHEPAVGSTGDAYYNRLRKIVEALFHAAHRRGLLADECMQDGKVNLRWASLFLSGKEVSQRNGATHTVRPAAAVFPPRLAQVITELLNVTNSASHVEKEQEAAKSLLGQTRQYVHTSYLLASLTYQLLDVLVWYRGYAADHSDKAANRATWVYPEPAGAAVAPGNGPLLAGRVDAINPKGFGYFLEDGKKGFGNANWISNQLVAAHKLQPGDRISVSLESPQADGKPPKVVKVERL